MAYRWRFPSPNSSSAETAEEAAALELTKTINVSESIAHILARRGITNFDSARDFFRPSLDRLNDPFLMDGMANAVERIQRAIKSQEKITIYGDYDVDGTTSTAMLVLFFESIGVSVGYHIPDRFTEGYGLSTAGIDRALSVPDPPSLILTVDCGITSIEAVHYAKSRGVEIIICDHHEPARIDGISQLPDAYAILNPIKGSCNYPYKYLCGCGVAFKLIQALSRKMDLADHAYEFLDFVALASSADIVSLQGENRTLTAFGLKKINEEPRPGIRALIRAAQLRLGRIGTSQLVFGMAPRINAAGRLGDGARAVKLLMSKTDDEAQHFAAELEFENSNRRRIDEEAFFEACGVVDGMLNRSIENHSRDRIIVLHNPAWHAGVIGIVASRLVERYHVPVVLLTTIDGVAKGSARSIIGFDIHSAIKQCESTVMTFGGHKYAAGLSIAVDRVGEFRTAINIVASELISDEMLEPELSIDATIDLNELNPKFFAIARQFQPFGPDNMRPMFHAANVEVVGTPRTVGKATMHLKLQVRSKTILKPSTNGEAIPSNLLPFTMGGAPIEAIGFGLGDRLTELKSSEGKGRSDVELVFYLEENEYNGRVTPQLVVKDFR